eukprot:10236980-Alexandrium_andersonii.AAC.1
MMRRPPSYLRSRGLQDDGSRRSEQALEELREGLHERPPAPAVPAIRGATPPSRGPRGQEAS